MRITVLRGGPGAEREVSLRSGAAVADGLRRGGHEVLEADISPSDLSALDRPCEVVFPALHGEFGEDGQLQAILEQRSIAYVGSDSATSRLTIDKLATKHALLAAGLPTPAFHVAGPADVSLGHIRPPCVVKLLCSGSSVGVFVCHSEAEALRHVHEHVDREGRALVEQFIAGPELTVGIVEDRALPPIRIVYESGFFDYRSKYSDGGARHDFETGLPMSTLARVQHAVERAHRVLGCRDLSRTDVMIDADGEFHLIEINTMPGFTSRSLLPEAAAKAGIDFVTLCDRLVRRAVRRNITAGSGVTASRRIA